MSVILGPFVMQSRSLHEDNHLVLALFLGIIRNYFIYLICLLNLISFTAK